MQCGAALKTGPFRATPEAMDCGTATFLLDTIWEEEHENDLFETDSTLFQEDLPLMWSEEDEGNQDTAHVDSQGLHSDYLHFGFSVPPASYGEDSSTVWLSLPSGTLHSLLMRSSSSGKKKTVQFALPGRIIRPLQWRDDVIWARVARDPTADHHRRLDARFESRHRRSASNSSSVDSYGNLSSQDDNVSSSSKDSSSGSNVVIVSCTGERSIIRFNSDSQSVDSRAEGARSDSDYQSKGESCESSMSECPSSDSGGCPLGQFRKCVQCSLLEETYRQLDAAKRELELKLRTYETQIHSLRQACSLAESSLRDEKSLHAVTRQELNRVMDRLKFYTGGRGAYKDYRAPKAPGSGVTASPTTTTADYSRRTFKKSRSFDHAGSEPKYKQVISVRQMDSLRCRTDMGVSVNVTSNVRDECKKLSAKMRYGIAAVFTDKSPKGPADRGISKPLHGVITDKGGALTVLSREVKLLQEERDRLQDLLQQSLQEMVPQHAAQVHRDLREQIVRLQKDNQQLVENYNAERILRKKYFNMVEDLKGKIRVYCRVKPLTNNDVNKNISSALRSTDDYTLVVQTQRGDKEFTFDRVFMPDQSQDHVFRETHSLIQSALDGYNVCIFAYGQTGSGKTHTLLGTPGSERSQDIGIVPRAFHRIFDLVRENEAKQEVEVRATFLELYNDRFIDLLDPEGSLEEKLEVRKDSSGQTLVPGATVEEVTSGEQLTDCFGRALKNRRVASTRMNVDSSRSHFVATVLVTSTNRFTGSVLRGKLSLVDLAGSERLNKSGLEGNHIKEANSINKSLSALGDVIQALASRQPHVPYRNNKLTMLMQDSLGGSAKTLMFVNVASGADNVDETINSLVYATRVKQITNEVTRAAETKEIAKLKSVIAKLKKEIGA